MILHNGGSQKKRFFIKDRFQNRRCETEQVRNQQTLCCQNNAQSYRCCKAQQRLMGLAVKPKAITQSQQPKAPANSSICKKEIDQEPPFILKVQNYKHINVPKTEGKLSNAIFLGRDGCHEYYPMDLASNDDSTLKKPVKSINKKFNDNHIKVKFENGSRTIERDLHSSIMYNITEKNPEKCINYKNILTGTDEKIKIFSTPEYDPSCILVNSSTSEKGELTDINLSRFQEWFDKNENAASDLYPGYKQLMANKRPLRISEALEMHERENKFSTPYKIDSSKNNATKNRFFPFSEEDSSEFENLKISELHENFIVKNPEKLKECTTDVSIGNEDDNQALFESFQRNDKTSKFLSCDNVSSKFNIFQKNSPYRNDDDSFRSRNSSNGNRRFCIFVDNIEKDYIQKTSSKNTTSQNDTGFKKMDRPSKNSDYITDRNNNRFNGKSNRYDDFLEEKKKPKAISNSNYENPLSSAKESRNFSGTTTTKKSFVSEDAYKEIKDFKQWSARNGTAEYSRDKQVSRRSEYINSRSDFTRKSLNEFNNKKFSDSSLPVKDYPISKKPPYSKVMPSKSDENDLSRNGSHNSVSFSGFQQKRQQKLLNSLTNKEPAKTSIPQAPQDLFKEYNTSYQQRLKYAKSCSDFSTLMKSSFSKYPDGKDKARTNSCLAQERLLSRKLSKT